LEVFECIQKRRTVRSYSDEPVSDEIVEEILESARLAPSATNRQEWAFVVVRDKETKKKVREAVAEIERTLIQQAWKRLFVGGAPLEAMAQSISKITGRNVTADNIDKQNDLNELIEKYTREEIEKEFRADVLIVAYRRAAEDFFPAASNTYDIGAALENMLLTATSRGLGSLWAGGFSRLETKIEYRANGKAVRACYRDRISEILHTPREMDLVALMFFGKSATEPPVPPRKAMQEIAFLNEYGNPWKKSTA
jgi:nitroreductase